MTNPFNENLESRQIEAFGITVAYGAIIEVGPDVFSMKGSNRGVHCFRLTPDLKITKLVPEEKLVDLLERCYLSLKSNVHGDTEDALIAELKVLLK